jgi:hypothetical protein
MKKIFIKIWQLAEPYLDIYSEKFGITREEMLAKLDEKWDEWFLTHSGKEMAEVELGNRSREIGFLKEAYYE